MPPLRLGASVLAIAPVVLLQLQTRSLHPPAAATVLLIALRGFQMTWSAVIALLAGVTMIAVAAELVRWLRLKQPSQS